LFFVPFRFFRHFALRARVQLFSTFVSVFRPVFAFGSECFCVPSAWQWTTPIPTKQRDFTLVVGDFPHPSNPEHPKAKYLDASEVDIRGGSWATVAKYCGDLPFTQ
jgi:hypothetical protein